MRRAPSGWPGIVGIVVLLGGLFVVHRVPAVTPAGGFLQDFLYADPAGPQAAIPATGAAENAAAADAAFVALGEQAYGEVYWSTVVATFGTEEEAAVAASEVDLPAGAVALRQGPMLVVTPLEHEPEGLPDPLIAVLEGLGADVLVEGDRYGEGTIVVDLTCSASSDEDAAELAEEIGDYGSLLYYSYARPPWVSPPLTDDEELARSTYRRWSSALADALVADGTLAEYGEAFLAASTDQERARLMAELEEHVTAVRMEGLEGEVHPGVAALLAATPTGTDSQATMTWGLQLGRFMGLLVPDLPDEAPSWFDQRVAASIGGVQATRSSVNIGWTTFNRFAIGMPALLDHLAARGCTDIRVGLTDFDDVRGD